MQPPPPLFCICGHNWTQMQGPVAEVPEATLALQKAESLFTQEKVFQDFGVTTSGHAIFKYLNSFTKFRK